MSEKPTIRETLLRARDLAVQRQCFEHAATCREWADSDLVLRSDVLAEIEKKIDIAAVVLEMNPLTAKGLRAKLRQQLLGDEAKGKEMNHVGNSDPIPETNCAGGGVSSDALQETPRLTKAERDELRRWMTSKSGVGLLATSVCRDIVRCLDELDTRDAEVSQLECQILAKAVDLTPLGSTLIKSEKLEWMYSELCRLRSGKLTDDELQNVCYDLDASDYPKFCDECDEYQRKIFGRCRSDELAKNVAISEPTCLDCVEIKVDVQAFDYDRGDGVFRDATHQEPTVSDDPPSGVPATEAEQKSLGDFALIAGKKLGATWNSVAAEVEAAVLERSPTHQKIEGLSARIIALSGQVRVLDESCDQLREENTKLESEFERFNADLKEAAGELLVELPLPHSPMAKVVTANRLLRGQVMQQKNYADSNLPIINGQKKRIDELEAEVDRLMKDIDCGCGVSGCQNMLRMCRHCINDEHVRVCGELRAELARLKSPPVVDEVAGKITQLTNSICLDGDTPGQIAAILREQLKGWGPK